MVPSFPTTKCAWWPTTGGRREQPDYISAVTEEPEEGSFALDGVDLGDDSPDAQLFRKAYQLVFGTRRRRDRWLQRRCGMSAITAPRA